MENDWRNLFSLEGKKIPHTLEETLIHADHLGIISLFSDENWFAEEKNLRIARQIEERYENLVFKLGQKLILKLELKSYLKIPENRDTKGLFGGIQGILEFYDKGLPEEFFPYHRIADAITSDTIPGTLIYHHLLLLKKGTPKNCPPMLQEYTLSPNI